MRVLVTGGAGFIGSALVRHLVLDKGYDVLNIDKLTYAGTLTSLASVEGNNHYRFLKADICDGRAISEAFESFRPDRVMHLAAESHVDRSITGAKDFVETNVLGTFTMLEAARAHWQRLSGEAKDIFRFLHVSTDEVYGSLGDDGLFTETTPYDPSSPYSASKAASDHLAKAWARTYKMPVVVSNCSNNYGPFHFPKSSFHWSSLTHFMASLCQSTAMAPISVTGFMLRITRAPSILSRSAAVSARLTMSADAMNGATLMSLSVSAA